MKQTTLYSRFMKCMLSLLVVSMAYMAAATDPSWWSARSVNNASAAKDHAMANQGQAKWLATQAEAELRANLPSPFNSAILGSLGSDNNHMPLNQGQLKNLIKPLYDRIAAAKAMYPSLPITMPAGMSGTYPWTTTTADDKSHSPVNLGQLKYSLSFHF